MKRILITLAVIFILGLGATWVADHPGMVAVDWGGWRIETSLGVIAAGIAALVFLVILVQSIWIWARRDLPFVGTNRALQRQRKGLDAMNRALLALASGDGKEARRLAERANYLLPPQPMTHVIAAQAAQMNGDKAGAKAAFERLAAEGDGRMLGLRGLMMTALEDGKRHEALRLAEEARSADPKSIWALKTHFMLLAKEGHWKEAAAALKDCTRRNVFPADRSRHFSRTISYCQAKEADLAGHVAEARDHADAALKIDPGFSVAAVLAARLAHSAGQTAKAKKVIEAAWSVRPTPELADAFDNLAPNETPKERLKRYQALIAKAPKHFESRYQHAVKLMEAGLLQEAAPLVDDLMAERESPRTFTLKAELIRAQGGANSETKAETYLAQAKTLAHPPSHHCTQCYHPARQWTPLCSECGAFDSLAREHPARPVVEAAQKPDQDILMMLPDPISAGSLHRES